MSFDYGEYSDYLAHKRQLHRRRGIQTDEDDEINLNPFKNNQTDSAWDNERTSDEEGAN